MKINKEILISVDEFEIRVAVVENRQLVEFYAEENDRSRITGNIYLGRVKDILPGMEAAFIDIGLERNAFLFINETLFIDAETELKPSRKKVMKPGQELLVQVAKDPVGAKGARVTVHLTIACRKMVLLPLYNFIGVSKKIKEDERVRLHEIAKNICPKDMGVIVRTAAADSNEQNLIDDLTYLLKKWESTMAQTQKLRAPAIVYGERNLAYRIVRDLFTEDYSSLIVDSSDMKTKILEYINKTSPKLGPRVRLHKGKIPLFDKYNIDSQLEPAVRRKVWLRSGGYVAIDKTEALTGIDVNTAKYTGGSDLEQTIFKTNMEAAVEVARQLRLRDIGGIIVIDFIDMSEQAHRDAVHKAFTDAMERDRTKSRVLEISNLGLMEMTRKNTSEGIQAYFFENCQTCGAGRLLSRKRAAIEAYRKIKKSVIIKSSPAYVFKVSPDIAAYLEEEGLMKHLSALSGKKVYIKADANLEKNDAGLLREGGINQIEKYFDGLGATD